MFDQLRLRRESAIFATADKFEPVRAAFLGTTRISGVHRNNLE